MIQMVTDMFSSMDSNDLKSLKTYLDSKESGIEKYTNSIEYSYSVTPQIYRQEEDGVRRSTRIPPLKLWASALPTVQTA